MGLVQFNLTGGTIEFISMPLGLATTFCSRRRRRITVFRSADTMLASSGDHLAKAVDSPWNLVSPCYPHPASHTLPATAPQPHPTVVWWCTRPCLGDGLMPDALFLLAVHVEVWKSGEDEVYSSRHRNKDRSVFFLLLFFFNLVVDWEPDSSNVLIT